MAEGMTSAPTRHAPTLDVEAIRAQFPILARKVHGHPVVYLDSAATSPVPTPVIEAMNSYWAETHAGVHRGLHTLSTEATSAYEGARTRIARFLGASNPSEIVLVRGVTEAMNLLASSWGGARLRPGDEVVSTVLEHHSNLVPWQQVCARTGATLRLARINDRGELDLEHLASILTPRTRLVAVTHVSNVTGGINDIGAIARLAHRAGALCFVDGAQAAAHIPIDVAMLGCDAYAISGHKMHGPTGIGALWCREQILRDMPPWQTGGEMIQSVTPETSTWAEPPARFEAGTPNSAGAVGLSSAIDFLASIGFDAIRAHERAILDRLVRGLESIPGVRILGRPAHRSGAVSFAIEGTDPHEAAMILDGLGIAVRSGDLCAQPLMSALGVDGALRASMGVFTSASDVDAMVNGIRGLIA